jgi:hypothetical protein
MTPVRLTKVLATADDDGIAQSQALAAAGNLVLNGALVTGGVALLGSQRRVAIVSGGNDSGKTATVRGTMEGNSAIFEVLALTNGGTVTSDLDFLTVSTIAVSAAAATTLKAGTTTTGSTPWIMPSFHLTPFNVNIYTQLTGSVTYNVETTQDDFWTAPRSAFTATSEPTVHQIVQGTTIAQSVTLDAAVTGFRYTITNGSGTLAAESTQAGIANY